MEVILKVIGAMIDFHNELLDILLDVADTLEEEIRLSKVVQLVKWARFEQAI